MTRKNVHPAQAFAIVQNSITEEKRQDARDKRNAPVQVKHSEVRQPKIKRN